MARKAAESQSSKSKNRAASPREKSAQKGRAPKRALATDEQDRIISTKAQRDIAAVCLIVLGIVLLVMVALPSNAVVTSAVSTGLKMAVGVASYILPFILIAAGVSLLIKFGSQRVPARVAIGLMVVFIAITGLMSLFAPGATSNPSVVFNPSVATALGGYVGAGIAYAGLSLFGQVISAIILIGIGVIGIIIIGFSLSQIIEKARAMASSEEGMPEAPFARVRMAMNGQAEEGEQAPHGRLKMTKHKTQVINPVDAKQTSAAALSAANTQVLDANGDKAPRRRNTRMSAADTVALSGTEKPMTRKLGKGSNDEKSASALTQALPKQAVGKKENSAMSAVATPRPADGFQLPDMACLTKTGKVAKRSEEEFRETGQTLQETLEDFGIMATVVGWVAGPTVTLFKVELPAGVRVSRITALNNDIALALAAPGVRIFAPIPGTNYVGIEVPNKDRQTVLLGDVLESAGSGPLQIAIGKDVEGNSIVSDLAKMPHLLIGGTTGSGKSVSINAMIMSILMRATPSEVRLIMIDPKRVEFTPYNGIPHLYVPVVTEPKEASGALSWGVAEMERRLKVFSKAGARNIGQYNAKVQNGELEEEGATEMPYIVIIIDELADLMMNVGKEVEYSISRIAQLARAAGIHLIVATQRPSANVVTGLIKANITNRIAFNVATGIDSRVILDTPGAENLIGLGDLLLSKPELSKPQRIQGCYVSETEINQVVEHLKQQGEPEYHNEILKTNVITLGDSSPDGSGGSSGSADPLIWEAAEIVVSSGFGSTSNLQRRLKVGYARAGRIMDELEEKGVVGPANGSKPREVLVDAMELETLKAFEAQDE